jgi:hypothetical protein
MTHWADKIVSNTEWALVRDAFEKQFETLGSPRDMMLIAVEGQADATRLIIGLPDDISLSPYDGFAVISGASLPRTASLQIGHKDRFEELFEYPNP